MPAHEVIVTVLVTAVFVLFGAALAFGSWQSNRRL
jgi:hypothetical protein